MQVACKVLLMGGGGNNLFQIARALSLKEKDFVPSLIFLPKYGKRIFRLLGLSLHDDWLDVRIFCRRFPLDTMPASVFDMLQLAVIYLFRRFGLSNFFDRSLDVVCKHYRLSKRVKYIDAGYFQGLEHLQHSSILMVAHELRDFLEKDSVPLDAVAHIRGGDFVERDRLSGADIESIVRHCESASLSLSIVTNDPEFVVRLLIDVDFARPSICSGSPRDDFQKLCFAKNIFLSNSTFSFWAGLVGHEVIGAKIFTPPKWHYAHFLDVEKLNLALPQ